MTDEQRLTIALKELHKALLKLQSVLPKERPKPKLVVDND